jgi:dTDP-4-amino-4,6-dideoxygalactose transaminase
MAQSYESDHAVAIRRLRELPGAIQTQRRNSDFYLRNLSVEAGMLCLEAPGAFFNRLQFPLLVPTSGQCDRLAELLHQDQISTIRPYKNITDIAAAHYGYKGECPEAERIAGTVLVIPSNHVLRNAELRRITASVNRAWAAIAKKGQPVAAEVACEAREMERVAGQPG